MQRASEDIGELGIAEADGWEDMTLLMDLQTALDQFEGFADEDALIFRIRYFLGCTFEEVAEIVDVSSTSAKRSFERTRAWLQRHLNAYQGDG